MRNVKYLQWAMMFILFALPSYALRFKILSIPVTVLELMILTTFAVWFFGSYKDIINRIVNHSKFKIQNSKFRRYPFDIEIVLLLIISFVSVGVAGFSNEAFGIWKAYFFEPLLFYILLFNVFGSQSHDCCKTTTVDVNLQQNALTEKGVNFREIFTNIIWPLAIAAFLISVFAVYQKFTGDFIANPFWSAETTRRVVSVFAYPNALGLYLAPLVLLIGGYIIFVNDKFKKLFLAITVILSLLSIYFAHSEGAIVGIIAGVIMFGLLIGKKIRWATLVVLGLALIMFFANTDLYNKVIEKGTLSDFSGEVRKQQWRETWAMLTESPQRFILGAGLANYQAAVKPYHQEGIFFNEDHDPDFRRKLIIFNDEYKEKHWRPVEVHLYPHNIFLNFWSELGLLGALLMVWIIGKFYYFGFRTLIQNSKFKIQNYGFNNRESYIVIALLGAMTVIIIHGAVDVPYFKNDLSIMFWVLVALMGMVSLLTNSQEK